ncbi:MULTISPECIES: hypothetical protein [Candidatus Accumulibacter]|uniref:Uncharacterized protein n=2 Tax=Candidatus Accumulibacter TaxID=327159 RepID=A0A7D5SCW5_9PROT|nr:MULTISPECIES: hypothetical protein [Candidatus Accumulibacter]MCM8620206.1 hypothetical protein [Accumulibacter sp.]QLH49298.1 MAG: hypothetical protein HWD57_05495 [Candidatus Accumulibacter cognatus]TMQ78926.1 hypothetical protein ACCUM_0523 [Candidatus Accumulibacter phosphatis]
MNPADQLWLENRVHAAIDDDFYLDRDEEKRIKEEAAARGIAVAEAELVIRVELEKAGAVCERMLLEELDRLLHQFTDNDKRLDGKEERDALDKVLAVATGKKKGLDPRVAAEYVTSFCRVHGVRRDSETKRWATPFIAFAIVAVLAVAGFWFTRGTKTERVTVVETKIVDSSTVTLSDKDKAEIDDQLRRATQFVEKAQYTDPPESSAKACLDAIRQIDPRGQYRGEEVKGIANRIVDHYLALADKSHTAKDTVGVKRWIERAKLMGAGTELIREKEKAFGLVRNER